MIIIYRIWYESYRMTHTVWGDILLVFWFINYVIFRSLTSPTPEDDDGDIDILDDEDDLKVEE